MTDPDIPTEALEAAARDARVADLPGDCFVCDGCLDAMLAAAAPHFIAEGRRQAAAAIREQAATGTGRITANGWAVRAEWAARIAEGGTDG